MNSFNHPALASVAAWAWRHVAGIQADQKHPGFKHFFIAPQLGGDLTWMKASYDSVRGRIECAYEVKDGKLTLRVTVPPNTTATVQVPAASAEAVTESSQPLTRAKGVKFVETRNSCAVFELQSGTYSFESLLAK
jgi:alpha-L-rhamnosidase